MLPSSGSTFKERFVYPILKFEKCCSSTGEKEFISELVLQDHSSEQEIELFRYEYNNRGERIVIHNGTINARKHVSGILIGTRPMGHIYSFEQVYEKNIEHKVYDHIIVSFSGWSDGTGAYTLILNLSNTQVYIEDQKKSSPVVDDHELLKQKYDHIMKTT